MKKRFTKIASVLLAASFILASCSKEENTTAEKVASVSNNADNTAGNGTSTDPGVKAPLPVTTVTDKPYTYHGKDGSYTGEWYEDRPEGHGTFSVNEMDRCEGEWSDGAPCGKVDIIAPDETGYMTYTGVYQNGKPSGDGYLTQVNVNNSYSTIVYGDFSDNSSLLWVALDENSSPVDIGIFNDDGEMLSLTDEENRKLVDGKRMTETAIKRYDGNYGYNYGEDGYSFDYLGLYYGATDEKGLPYGYGYFVGYEHWTKGDDSQFGPYSLHLIGFWENGKLDENRNASFIYYDNCEEQRIGKYMENGRFEGKYTLIKSKASDFAPSRYGPVDLENGYTNTKKVYNQFKNLDEYKKNEDGIYVSLDSEYIEDKADGRLIYTVEYSYITDYDACIEAYNNNGDYGQYIVHGSQKTISENGEITKQETGDLWIGVDKEDAERRERERQQELQKELEKQQKEQNKEKWKDILAGFIAEGARGLIVAAIGDPEIDAKDREREYQNYQQWADSATNEEDRQKYQEMADSVYLYSPHQFTNDLKDLIGSLY
ncbi:MAG: hypothetical protein IK093_19980 [Ruminiclostridium sp.]|nr:hypothetical protein [Ruminiclostridium sp.]